MFLFAHVCTMRDLNVGHVEQTRSLVLEWVLGLQMGWPPVFRNDTCLRDGKTEYFACKMWRMTVLWAASFLLSDRMLAFRLCCPWEIAVLTCSNNHLSGQLVDVMWFKNYCRLPPKSLPCLRPEFSPIGAVLQWRPAYRWLVKIVWMPASLGSARPFEQILWERHLSARVS